MPSQFPSGLLSPNPRDSQMDRRGLARQKDSVSAVLDDPPTARVRYDEKNVLNNMTTDYAKEQRKKYLKQTAQIRTFLAAPENLELQRMYESVVDEFSSRLLPGARTTKPSTK